MEKLIRNTTRWAEVKASQVRMQHDKCSVCLRLMTSKTKSQLYHSPTGEVRGALCFNCYRNLSWYERSRQRIERFLTQKTEQIVAKANEVD